VDNLKELRDSITALQKQNRELRKDLDTLQKKLSAKPGGALTAPKSRGR